MGSLLRSVPQKVSPFDPFLHGLGEGAAQGAGVAAGADGAQSLHLDLAGPLLAYAEGLRDPAPGAGLAAVEPVAHLDDLGLALGKGPYRLDERHLPLADLAAGGVPRAPPARAPP